MRIVAVRRTVGSSGIMVKDYAVLPNAELKILSTQGVITVAVFLYVRLSGSSSCNHFTAEINIFERFNGKHSGFDSFFKLQAVPSCF